MLLSKTHTTTPIVILMHLHCAGCTFEMKGTGEHSSGHEQGWRQPFRRSSRRY